MCNQALGLGSGARHGLYRTEAAARGPTWGTPPGPTHSQSHSKERHSSHASLGGLGSVLARGALPGNPQHWVLS